MTAPMVQMPMPAAPPARQRKGFAITALVLGLVAILGSWMPLLNIMSVVIGIVGAVFGVIAIILAFRGTAGGKGMAIAGTVLSVLAIVLSSLVGAATVSAVDHAAESAPSVAAEAASAAAAAPDEQADTSKAEFGAAFVYPDGLSVTVSAPKDYKPSEFAVTDGKGHPVQFSVTVKNGTKEPFDPSLFSTSVSSKGSESEAIYDSGKKVGGAPDTKVRPGKSATWLIGYTVADKGDITMDVRPEPFTRDEFTLIKG